MKTLRIIDLVETPMKKGRFLYMLFDAPPVVGKRYYINKIANRDDCAEVSEHILTGFEVYYYSVTAGSFTPQIQIDGKEYNVIPFADINLVLVTLAKTQKDVRLYKSPMVSLAHGIQLELRRYKLDIDLGQSFIQFVDTTFTAAFPLVIPFMPFWEE